ncbi:MAG: hypothetical protein Q9218_003639 [Villophora microphyllina]
MAAEGHLKCGSDQVLMCLWFDFNQLLDVTFGEAAEIKRIVDYIVNPGLNTDDDNRDFRVEQHLIVPELLRDWYSTYKNKTGHEATMVYRLEKYRRQIVMVDTLRKVILDEPKKESDYLTVILAKNLLTLRPDSINTLLRKQRLLPAAFQGSYERLLPSYMYNMAEEFYHWGFHEKYRNMSAQAKKDWIKETRKEYPYANEKNNPLGSGAQWSK